MKELNKRLLTSILLIILLLLVYKNNLVLFVIIISSCLIMSKEFYFLINRINTTQNLKINFLGTFIWFILSLYVAFFGYISILSIQNFDIIFLLTLTICVATDIGGFVFGNIFKGQKLTKISPNKTISGSVGSFFFSLMIALFFCIKFNSLFENNIKVISFFVSCLFISLLSQIGDLFISFLKRKAKVKNTGNLLPGHGGILDRLDGVIFTVIIGTYLIKFILY